MFLTVSWRQLHFITFVNIEFLTIISLIFKTPNLWYFSQQFLSVLSVYYLNKQILHSKLAITKGYVLNVLNKQMYNFE